MSESNPSAESSISNPVCQFLRQHLGGFHVSPDNRASLISNKAATPNKVGGICIRLSGARAVSELDELETLLVPSFVVDGPEVYHLIYLFEPHDQTWEINNWLADLDHDNLHLAKFPPNDRGYAIFARWRDSCEDGVISLSFPLPTAIFQLESSDQQALEQEGEFTIYSMEQMESFVSKHLGDR
ncbi:hypothetical protein ACFX5Q_25730 [Mesorhizobium sp. IMUNJ 23033]|uniref:hypothetical protein n=1 Tax=Mesorhizobium sp. IMUNJ 23033 TaxID=3378039 RepID=UPI00384FCCD6